MKIRHGLVVLALSAALLAGGAPPAAAYGGHTVTIKGTMVLRDDENLGSDETLRVTFSDTVNLRHGAPRGRVGFTTCVGGEVTGDFTVAVTLEGNELVVWQPTLNLYEGTSCLSGDLDGQVIGRARTTQPNYYETTWIQTWNKDEDSPDDRVRVDYELHHDAS